MSRTLHTHGEYPANWKQISDDVWASARHRTGFNFMHTFNIFPDPSPTLSAT